VVPLSRWGKGEILSAIVSVYKQSHKLNVAPVGVDSMKFALLFALLRGGGFSVSPATTVIETKSNETSTYECDLSVVVVSFNTRDVLRRCLRTLDAEGENLSLEILVVDNGSRDGSVEMMAREFPHVRLFQAGTNLGFAAANNVMFSLARGRYIVMLNSDAFLRPGALHAAIEHMNREPNTALAGARLVGEQGNWQPSARMFPSPLNDFLMLSGLAHRFRSSRLLGRADRTWADPLEEADVDWVPGAFSIIRPDALKKIGTFDESFFLYCEEVDLCRRLKAAGYAVRYWPNVVVVHLGGESSKSVQNAVFSISGSQLALWRLRSSYLYYRKHHGSGAWRIMAMECGWHWLRMVWNRMSRDPRDREKFSESCLMISLIGRAWKETNGGRVSPSRPW
jgi:GT2 family glycosyltransferase